LFQRENQLNSGQPATSDSAITWPRWPSSS
jgi:hypothetical protein